LLAYSFSKIVPTPRVALYLVELLPMDATLKLIIRVLIILVLLLWLLQTLGVLGPTMFLHR
jgi:hypothetical protein